MTNAFHNRHGFGASSLCPLCDREEETIVHILRDCSWVKGIWEAFVRQEALQEFFWVDKQ